MIAVSEAFVLGEKLGLSHQTLFDVASASSGQCWSLTSYCPVPGPVPDEPGEQRLPRRLRGGADAQGSQACQGGRAISASQHRAWCAGRRNLPRTSHRKARARPTSRRLSTSCASSHNDRNGRRPAARRPRPYHQSNCRAGMRATYLGDRPGTSTSVPSPAFFTFACFLRPARFRRAAPAMGCGSPRADRSNPRAAARCRTSRILPC